MNFSYQFSFVKCILVFCTILLLSFAVISEEKNAEGKVKEERDFGAYSLIFENNLFNANRKDRSRKADLQKLQKLPTEHFSLVGILHSDARALAFFSGTDPYRVVLKPNEIIAGYCVKQIGEQSILLEKDGKPIEFVIGMRMRKRGDADWELLAAKDDFETSMDTISNETPALNATSKSEILKRLMERRRRQLEQ